MCWPLFSPKAFVVTPNLNPQLRCRDCLSSGSAGLRAAVVVGEIKTVVWIVCTCETPCLHSKQRFLLVSTFLDVSKLVRSVVYPPTMMRFSLLKAAEEYHLPKALRCSKGGGLKEFSQQDFQYFEGSNNEQSFFTTEERQWLVLRILESIRAKPSDLNALPGVNLLEGQPIGINMIFVEL